ncbi:MAG: hypothetical protein N3E52_03680 [Candidatus Bathyarchaeota archaeon]|nr:hypothetical protein [Candidatus Bathyarchaeota archaeon]
MDYYQTVATASLILQIATLCVMFAGLAFKRQKRLRQHGLTMLAAVTMHTGLILAWMVPSFTALFISPTNLIDIFVVAILAHAFTGAVADALGIWLVASWRPREDMQACFAKKRVMRVTTVLWLIALLLGFVLYLKIIKIL